MKAWETEILKESKKKPLTLVASNEEESSVAVEEGALGKRKVDVSNLKVDIDWKKRITTEDLVYTMQTNPKLNKTKMLMDTLTKIAKSE